MGLRDDIKGSAVDIARLYATACTDISAWWNLIKRWGGKIFKTIVCLCLLIIQVLAGATTAQAECGIDGGSDQMIASGANYPTSANSGNPDMTIAKMIYDTVKQRYADSNDAERILEATMMTALAESNIHNLSSGDQDSVGVFQQRASWGSVSQRTNPQWAINAFLAKLDKVRTSGANNKPSWELAQDVQGSFCTNKQNAAAVNACDGIYGGNYKRKLTQAQAIIKNLGGPIYSINGQSGYTGTLGSVASTTVNAVNGTPASNIIPAAEGACDGAGNFSSVANISGQKNVAITSTNVQYTLDVIPEGQRGAVISAALSQIGVTYVYGGNTWNGAGAAGQASSGAGASGALDCSSLVQQALKRGANITVPRLAHSQYVEAAKKLSGVGQLVPGDLIFWSEAGPNEIHHVAMYLGTGSYGGKTGVPLIVAAPKTGDTVKIQPYYTEGNMFYADPGYNDSTAPTAAAV